MIKLIIAVFVLCAIVTIFVALQHRMRRTIQRSVDLNAFQVLIDRDDENFLRARLPRKMFFQLKRQRIRVSWGYISRMSGNAENVLRCYGGARLDSDPRVAEQAAQSIECATHLRMHCLVAYAKLGVEFAFPSMQLTPARLASEYESLRDSVARLALLQPQNENAVTVAL